jgi:hypothetical protein
MVDCQTCDHPAFAHDDDGCQAEGCDCTEYVEPEEDAQPLDFDHDDAA